MKASLLYAIVIVASASFPLIGEQSLDSIQKMEAAGDSMGARAALARTAQANPNRVAAWTAYAELLDRYGDPGAREAYGHLLANLRNAGDSQRAAAVARRPVVDWVADVLLQPDGERRATDWMGGWPWRVFRDAISCSAMGWRPTRRKSRS